MSDSSSNLYQRKGVWYVRVQINGRDLRRSLKTSSKIEAEERAAFAIRKATSPAHPTGARVRRQSLIKLLAGHTAASSSGNFVYFIQRADGGPIKIGRSRRPDMRVATIQRGHPLPMRILCCVPAPTDYETTIHRRFAKDHVPLHKWIYAMYLVVTARKGVSSMQLAKEIGVTQKTAWFVLGRLREACKGKLTKLRGLIELDETFVGGIEANKHEPKRRRQGRGPVGKTAVLGMPRPTIRRMVSINSSAPKIHQRSAHRKR